MTGERIDRDETLAELGAEIDAAAYLAHDEGYLDRNLRPISDRELLERARWY